MRRFWTLFLKELTSITLAPASYAVVALVWIVFGVQWLWWILPASQGDTKYLTMTAGMTAFGLQSFLVPLQTMRAISEERRSGTFEMLITAPLRDHEVVLAKFFSILIFNAVTWLILPLYALIIRLAGGNIDFAPVLTTYIAVVTTGALMISLCLLASASTRHVFLAGFLGLVLCIAITLVPMLWQIVPEDYQTIRSVLVQADLAWQMDQAGWGILDLVHLTYKLAFAAFFLLVTTRILEMRKWA